MSETTGAETVGYVHNVADQLTMVDRPSGPDVSHSYTADGAREATTVGSETLTYLYGPAGRIVGADDDISGVDVELSWSGDGYMNTFETVYAGGGDSSRIVWDPTMAVPQVLDITIDGVEHRQNYGIKRLNSYGVWYGYDWQDSAVSSAGYPTNPTGYTPWGESEGALAGVYFGYRGELTIGGIIHLRNRNYEPDTGVFLSPDPLDGVDGEPTVANPYHYASNDPLNRIDPLGLRPMDRCIMGTGGCDTIDGRLVAECTFGERQGVECGSLGPWIIESEMCRRLGHQVGYDGAGHLNALRSGALQSCRFELQFGQTECGAQVCRWLSDHDMGALSSWVGWQRALDHFYLEWDACFILCLTLQASLGGTVVPHLGAGPIISIPTSFSPGYGFSTSGLADESAISSSCTYGGGIAFSGGAHGQNGRHDEPGFNVAVAPGTYAAGCAVYVGIPVSEYPRLH